MTRNAYSTTSAVVTKPIQLRPDLLARELVDPGAAAVAGVPAIAAARGVTVMAEVVGAHSGSPIRTI